MKTVSFTISLILICYIGYGQSNPFPIGQNIGGPATAVKTPSYGAFYGGIIPYTFADTTAANTALTYGKTYNGFTIYTQSPQATWWRLADSSKWVMILPQGGGTPVSGQAWINPGNYSLFTDAKLNGAFGTLQANGIYIKTNGITRAYLDRYGIAPETGTTVGLGIDPSDSNRITYFSGSGSTPTWQQTLTSGSALTQANNITGAFAFSFTDPTSFKIVKSSVERLAITNALTTIQGASTTGASVQLSSTTGVFSSTNTTELFSGNVGANQSILDVKSDSIVVQPYLGYLSIDTLTNLSTQNTLLGWVQGSGQGRVGYITLSGLTLSGGVLTNPNPTPGANTALSNLASVAINTSLLPGVTNSIDVGSGSFVFRNGYFGTSVGIGNTSPTQLLSLGTSGSISGIFNVAGSTSGTITFQPQAAAGTYNWNWPTTAGTSGYFLTSAGGGSSAMTWTDPTSLNYANKALSNLASVAVNTSILPGTTNSIALGSTAKIWSDVQSDYFHTGGLSATYGGYSGAILGGTATHAVLDFFDNNTRVAELYTTSTSANFYTNTASAFNFYTNNSLSTAVMTFSGGQNVLIGGSTDPTSAVSALGIYNGTAPTGSIVNGTILYSEDVAASSELKVRDEAGNITVLSPHHFLELGKPSEEQAWSYYSEKDGKYITVDMTKAIRTIEELTQRVYLLEKQLGIEATKPVKLIFKGKVKK